MRRLSNARNVPLTAQHASIIRQAKGLNAKVAFPTEYWIQMLSNADLSALIPKSTIGMSRSAGTVPLINTMTLPKSHVVIVRSVASIATRNIMET